jgi:hypothetical protein
MVVKQLTEAEKKGHRVQVNKSTPSGKEILISTLVESSSCRRLFRIAVPSKLHERAPSYEIKRSRISDTAY